jgi:hypothetical protein
MIIGFIEAAIALVDQVSVCMIVWLIQLDCGSLNKL